MVVMTGGRNRVQLVDETISGSNRLRIPLKDGPP
jgi:hypothetical protein